MPRSLRLTCVLALGGCTFLGRSAPPPDRSQDARIAQEVRARLAAEPSIDSGSVRVEVDGGVVVLHGSVRGIGAWQCAVTNGGLVQGVRSVVDYLVIERGPRDVQCIAPRSENAVINGRE
jgi:hypothetical protein